MGCLLPATPLFRAGNRPAAAETTGMILLSILLTLFTLPVSRAETSFLRGELLFPPEKLHNHGSCIVELPNGDLLACWYRGSGERGADDVAVMGARRKKNASEWSKPFLMADTPGFPDTNPCMVLDPQQRLWLLWPTILDNHWESALMKFKVSRNYAHDGVPIWERENVLHLKPGPEFLSVMKRDLYTQYTSTLQNANPDGRERVLSYLAERLQRAAVPLTIRLGWMTRAHPFILDGKRLIVPLYSDGFDFSLMAITDDWGETWKCSEPLVGAGNVQPSIVQRRDGTLVAYFRDNGPPPQRVQVSESRDGGLTWTLAHDIDYPNPGSGLEAIVLKSGRWLLVGNDTEKGRHQLAVAVSEDAGKTWSFRRYLEKDEPGEGAGSYAYPSIIQARDGTIHVTYSYTPDKAGAMKEGAGETIKHVQFNEAWLLEGRDAK